MESGRLSEILSGNILDLRRTKNCPQRANSKKGCTMQSQKSQPPKIDYSMLKNFEGVDLSNPRIAMDLISRVVFEHGLDRLPRMAIAMKIMEAGHLPTSVGSFSLQKVSAAFRRQRKELGHVLDELIRPSGNFTTNIL